MPTRALAHRAPLLGLVAAWAAGSALVHSGLAPAHGGLWCALALAGLGATWLAGLRRPALVWLGMGLALLAAGALRTAQERNRPVEWDALQLPPREARLTLRVEHLFAPSEGQNDTAGGIARVTLAEPHLRDLKDQRIQFFVTWPENAPPATRGMEFTALGLLRPVPAHAAATDFDGYLAASGVNFAFSRARLEAAPREGGPWRRFCTRAENKLESILRAGLEHRPELADLYVAMMLGQKSELGEERKEWFVRSGTMHLFAISGLHVAGIAVALHTLLALARVPRAARFAAGTALLWIFVDITGAAPSAVRAFWMVTCLFAARQLRTPGNSVAALAASALVVLVLDPHQLFAAGFQMSYGIVAALLLYGVPLQEKWHDAWRPGAGLPEADRSRSQRLLAPWVQGAMGVLALGLAATLVSLPAAVAFFGLMTPGGFFINLLLVPVSSLVLFAGVAATAFGLAGIMPAVELFNHAAALVLAAMEGVVILGLKMPGLAWESAFIFPWLGPLFMAGMPALLALGYMRGWRARDGGYWTPWAVLGLGLVLATRSV